MTNLPNPSEPSPRPPKPGKRRTGEVKWFDARRGFGFILTDDGGDVFVHYSNIRQDGFRSLGDGRVVEYTAAQGEKGWYAEDVVVVELKSRSQETTPKETGESSAVPPSAD